MFPHLHQTGRVMRPFEERIRMRPWAGSRNPAVRLSQVAGTVAVAWAVRDYFGAGSAGRETLVSTRSMI